MFWSYTKEFKYSFRAKRDISEVVNTFTTEDKENMPPELQNHLVLSEFYEWCIFHAQ